MHLVSFENDLDSLKLARVNNNLFPYVRHAAPDAILQHGQWQSPLHAGLSWTLMRGNFLETLSLAPALPDVIFYDMFSSKSDGEHWTPEAFRRLFAVCGGRAAELFTYTCSTAIRAALLEAGFHVAKGRSTGEKTETTIAATPLARCALPPDAYDWLAGDWLEKWARSGAQFPMGIAPEDRPAFERAIRCHPQFAL